MMKFTKTAGAIAATTLLLAGSANATIFNASASFRTIADITITEDAALTFGGTITGKAGTTCSLATALTAGAGAVVPDVFAPGDITGDGCSATAVDMVPGNYAFLGVSGSTVTVLMTTATDTDFTFAPAGDYNDQAAAADVSTTYFADAPFNVTLAGAAGEGRLIVGGTLNIINTLAASTSYAIAYDISVVY